MKKVISILVMFCIAICSSSIYGASSISVNRTSVTKGDTITVSATVSSVATWSISITPSGPVTYLSGTTSDLAGYTSNNLNGSKTISATYRSTGTGTATFRLSGDTTDQNGITANVSTSKSVTIKAAAVAPATPTTTKSTNANLKKLVPNYEGLSPNFNSSVTKYSLTVPATATSLKLAITTEGTGAKYYIDGENNLKLGDNTVRVTVTAASGAKKVYTIIVTKAADVTKANAYLSSIVIDGKTLSPIFTAETLEYDIGIVESSVDKITVLAYPQSSNANVAITGNDALVDGANIIKVKVTAEDNVTVKEYSIKVMREAGGNGNVNIYGETNNLKGNTTNKTEKLASSFWTYIKKFWLTITLAVICLLEFGQIVYLYSKINKMKKSNNEDIKPLKLGEDNPYKRRNKPTERVEMIDEFPDIKDENIEENNKK